MTAKHVVTRFFVQCENDSLLAQSAKHSCITPVSTVCPERCQRLGDGGGMGGNISVRLEFYLCPSEEVHCSSFDKVF